MKKLSLLLYIVLLTTNLYSRMNPFEPTDTFKEQQQEYLTKQQQAKEKELAIQKQKKLELLQQQEGQKKAEQLQLKQEQQAKLEQQKKIEALKKAQRIHIAQKKKEAEIDKDSYKILPFVHIKVSRLGLEIFIDKRYKLINQDILKDQKKVLFDFRATESFYTVKKVLNYKNFKAFAIGSHMEKNFFRIVVDLTDNVSKYKEYINSKNNSIKISKIK